MFRQIRFITSSSNKLISLSIVPVPPRYGASTCSSSLLFITLALFSLGHVALPSAAAEQCACSSPLEFSKSRLKSAEALIEAGQTWQQNAHALYDRSLALKETGGVSVTVDARAQWQKYQDIFSEYQQALSAYKKHRQQYFDHVQAYHNQANAPETVNGTPSGSEPDRESSPLPGMRALQFKAEERCSQLQELEASLIANERQLQEMLKELASAQQRESGAMFASLWAQANELATNTHQQASQFNHLGFQKTLSASQAVHSLILEANRDGAYSAHLDAYRDLSRANRLQQEILNHANLHGKLSMLALVRLNALRPAASAPDGPAPTTSEIYSADDLARESAGLDQEYTKVQSIFAKLEEIRKALPPELENKTSGN